MFNELKFYLKLKIPVVNYVLQKQYVLLTYFVKAISYISYKIILAA